MFWEQSCDIWPVLVGISLWIPTSVHQHTGSRPHTGAVMNVVCHPSPQSILVYFLMRRLVLSATFSGSTLDHMTHAHPEELHLNIVLLSYILSVETKQDTICLCMRRSISLYKASAFMVLCSAVFKSEQLKGCFFFFFLKNWFELVLVLFYLGKLGLKDLVLDFFLFLLILTKPLLPITKEWMDGGRGSYDITLPACAVRQNQSQNSIGVLYKRVLNIS